MITVFALAAAVCMVRGSSRYSDEPDVKKTSGNAGGNGQGVNPQLVSVGPTLISSAQTQQTFSNILLPQPPAPALPVIQPDVVQSNDVQSVSPRVTVIKPKIRNRSNNAQKSPEPQSVVQTAPVLVQAPPVLIQAAPVQEQQAPVPVQQAPLLLQTRDIQQEPQLQPNVPSQQPQQQPQQSQQPEAQPLQTTTIQTVSAPPLQLIATPEPADNQIPADSVPFNSSQRLAQNPQLLQTVSQEKPEEIKPFDDFIPFNPSQRLAQNPQLLKQVNQPQSAQNQNPDQGVSMVVSPVTTTVVNDVAMLPITTLNVIPEITLDQSQQKPANDEPVLDYSFFEQHNPNVFKSGEQSKFNSPQQPQQPQPKIADDSNFIPNLIAQPQLQEPQIADDSKYLPVAPVLPPPRIADDSNFLPNLSNQAQEPEPAIADDSNFLPNLNNQTPEIQIDPFQPQLIDVSPVQQADDSQSASPQIQTVVNIPKPLVVAPRPNPLPSVKPANNFPAQAYNAPQPNRPVQNNNSKFSNSNRQDCNQNNRPAAPIKIPTPKPENFPGPINRPKNDNNQGTSKSNSLTPDKWVNRRSSTQQTDINYFKQKDGNNSSNNQGNLLNVGIFTQQPPKVDNYPTYVSQSSYQSPSGSNPQINSWSKTTYQSAPNSNSFSQVKSVSSNGNWIQVIPSKAQPANNNQPAYNNQQSYGNQKSFSQQSYNQQFINIGAQRLP